MARTLDQTMVLIILQRMKVCHCKTSVLAEKVGCEGVVLTGGIISSIINRSLLGHENRQHMTFPSLQEDSFLVRLSRSASTFCVTEALARLPLTAERVIPEL